MGNPKHIHPNTVHAIGVWTTRIILVIGAIVCGALGKNEAASTLGCVAIISFWLL